MIGILEHLNKHKNQNGAKIGRFMKFLKLKTRSLPDLWNCKVFEKIVSKQHKSQIHYLNILATLAASYLPTELREVFKKEIDKKCVLIIPVA